MDVDIIYYINLEHRKDRNEQFLEEIQRMRIDLAKVHRIEGIFTPGIGQLGCVLSHIKALQNFLESSYQTCLIFEDDFQVLTDINYTHFLLKNLLGFVEEFDVIMLAGNILQKEYTTNPFLHRVLEAQTSASYIVNRKFAPILLQNFQESSKKIEESYLSTKKIPEEYSLDVYWKKLQPISNWFVLNPKIGVQRESYSDIENKVTNYGV